MTRFACHLIQSHGFQPRDGFAEILVFLAAADALAMRTMPALGCGISARLRLLIHLGRRCVAGAAWHVVPARDASV